MGFHEGVVGKSIVTKIYGEDAKKVFDTIMGDIDTAMDGLETDMNTKVYFRYRSVEGKPVIEMEVML